MAENTDVVKKVEELKKKATELSSFISGFADAAFANKEIEELTDKLLALLRGSGKKTKTTISRIPAHEKYYGRMKDSVDKLEIAKLSSDVSSLFAQDVVPYEYVVDLNKIPEIKQIFSVLSTVMKNSKLVLRVNAWRIGHFVDKLFAAWVANTSGAITKFKLTGKDEGFWTWLEDTKISEGFSRNDLNVYYIWFHDVQTVGYRLLFIDTELSDYCVQRAKFLHHAGLSQDDKNFWKQDATRQEITRQSLLVPFKTGSGNIALSVRLTEDKPTHSEEFGSVDTQFDAFEATKAKQQKEEDEQKTAEAAVMANFVKPPTRQPATPVLPQNQTPVIPTTVAPKQPLQNATPTTQGSFKPKGH